MNIYIPTHNRAKTHTTYHLVKNLPDTVRLVVHDGQQAAEYMRYGVPAEHIIVSNAPYTISHQRQFILDHAPEEGWFLMLDDNIGHFEVLSDYWWYETDELTDEHVLPKKYSETSPQQFMLYLEEAMRYAESVGSHLLGAASTSNTFFNRKKYIHAGFTLGKILGVRKPTRAVFDAESAVKEDYQFSAENIYQYGKAVVCRWLRPGGYKHFQKGGCGTMDERAIRQVKAATRIMQLYPGLYRIKDRANRPKGGEIQQTLNTEKGIERWRAEMRAFRTENPLNAPLAARKVRL